MEKAKKLMQIHSSGVVAVIRRQRPEDVVPLAEALVKGGVTTLEITVDSEQSYHLIGEVKKRLGTTALVGAGTVLDAETAKTAIQAGADFIFSPIYSKSLIEMAKRYGVISMPGVLTPSEMVEAYQAGADIVKVFPASAFGPSYIKDLQGPLGHISMIPTGGVTVENIGTYIANGAVAAGVGGSLVKQTFIDSQDFASITTLAEQFSEAVKNARTESDA
ncbi:bifunctional 4-hydroxy-2-oxoglutarate aldolase/2-dehydro-3-deoxy-phosphogluconate aldolase [Guptibacillus hwajinpoensis]|uniref:bifunctional 4-hydroxy-2-oxoglutarate aldolase/2-dehydro-3-deoxy-phosphogluconate aldolase n=1 Tax=Guptibacillus hwajinpoensis TaxID=208199 RepID=UPI001CFD5661|nr:bifunctional 4-hydroxy-2-oxoglutarate aldolase/2-dehydro-3-deoxy-phosphogluconate aldolase [Pseudalkalibacillus hwajinpoensis]